MCGIVGGNSSQWRYEEALNTIAYRGPDSRRIQRFQDFTMGFVRLAIMDLSDNGMQPMIAEDGNTAIVFNGEIYGFMPLKRELEKKGYCFHSHSDTEVILYAYQEYGDAFIDKIDGMYAIGIYDKRVRCIKLYRDRAGIKPLFYYYDGKKFAFASEIKTIKALCNDVEFITDHTAIYDFLTYNYIPDPKTIYRNLYKLLPAHYLRFEIPTQTITNNEPYWQLKVNENESGAINVEEVKEEIGRLIHESVKEQLVADVPVGSFLSGGIDSSIITYEIKQLNPMIEAFSMGFGYQKYNELEYAELLATHINIIRNEQIANKSDIEILYPHLVEWYDEPFADTSAYPTYLVSKMAREKVTVVLTGDGGDEVFGGYSRYNTYRLEAGTLEMQTHLERMCELTDGMTKEKKRLWKRELCMDDDYDDYWAIREHYHQDLPPLTRFQYVDFHTYLPGDILTKVDRASMQVSLETRIPLLSQNVIEYVFSLPEQVRCPSGTLKGMMKEAYRGKIPDRILDRRKMGFVVPDTYLRAEENRQEQILTDLWGYQQMNETSDMKKAEDGKVHKFKTYYNILNQWLKMKNEGKGLAEYFIKHKWKEVAIYGMGEIGCRLYEELENSAVKIVYAVDKEGGSVYEGLKVYTLEEDWPTADVLVVTAAFAYDKIVTDIQAKVNIPVVSLEEVVTEGACK